MVGMPTRVLWVRRSAKASSAAWSWASSSSLLRVAGLVQISAHVEVDQALPARLDASHLFANGDDVASSASGWRATSTSRVRGSASIPSTFSLMWTLHRLSLDPDSTAAPWPGGKPGAPGENWLLPGGDESEAERLPDKCTIHVQAGDMG